MTQNRIRVSTETHGEVTIESRGKKGIYHVSFYQDRSHRRVSLKTSNKNKALEYLPSVLGRFSAARVTHSNLEICSAGMVRLGWSLKLSEGLRLYLESLRDKNCHSKTVQQAETRINAFINHIRASGIEDFSGVQPIHADTFYRGLTTGTNNLLGKRKRHANTAAGYFRFVKAMLEFLESRNLIQVNPFRKINYEKVPHKNTPKPNLENVNKILELVETRFKIAAHALAFLGCRVEALTRIQNKHVNVKDGFLLIEKPAYRSKTVERYVPIHPRLLQLLKNYKKPKSQYYFCMLPSTRTKGGQKMKANDLNKAIQQAAKKAGFPAGRKEGGIVAHSFRGFFKSHCIKQLIPREIVDIWQGHRSDDSIGTRHYVEFSLEESIEFMRKVDFGSI